MTPLTRWVEHPEYISNIVHSSPNSTNTKTQYSEKKKKEEVKQSKQGVLKQTLPYKVVDSGTTLNCGRTGDPFIKTEKQSTKSYHTPFDQVANAMEKAQLHANVWDPSRTVNIVPGLKHNSQLSISKFVEANYQTIFTPIEVQTFDGDKATIASMMEPILQGWKDLQTGQWWVPILHGQNTENCTQQEEAKKVNLPNQNQMANNMYNLLSMKQTICYHHAAAGFPARQHG